MLKHHPERVQSAVLAQPIGRVGPMAPAECQLQGLTETLGDRPEATEQVLNGFYQNLYAPGFAYCADRDFAKTIKARAWSSPAMTRRIPGRFRKNCRS